MKKILWELIVPLFVSIKDNRQIELMFMKQILNYKNSLIHDDLQHDLIQQMLGGWISMKFCEGKLIFQDINFNY